TEVVFPSNHKIPPLPLLRSLTFVTTFQKFPRHHKLNRRVCLLDVSLKQSEEFSVHGKNNQYERKKLIYINFLILFHFVQVTYNEMDVIADNYFLLPYDH